MNAPANITPPQNVYGKIAAVQGELAKVGIAKGRRNQQQGYNFRGIDEVYAALSPLLARYGLVIVPRVIAREVVERQTAKGGALFNVTVHAEFDFISADDGSKHTAATYGEAMDSADKATNKAMSAAYKYAAFMTFAIPTEGDNDADAHTHEVAPRQAGRTQQTSEVSSPAVITAAQWGILTDLIEKTKADAKAFCTHFAVASVKEMPADRFDEARALLNKKLAGKAPKPADAYADIDADSIPY